MHGKGTFSWPDGRRYEGEYKFDKKHNFGVYFWPGILKFIYEQINEYLKDIGLKGNNMESVFRDYLNLGQLVLPNGV